MVSILYYLLSFFVGLVKVMAILAAVRLRTWQTRFELGLDLKSRFRFRHYAGPDLDHSPSSQVGWTWTPGSEPGP